jgi:hypothetical protein
MMINMFKVDSILLYQTNVNQHLQEKSRNKYKLPDGRIALALVNAIFILHLA